MISNEPIGTVSLFHTIQTTPMRLSFLTKTTLKSQEPVIQVLACSELEETA